MITAAQLAEFEQQGYLVIPDYFNVDPLRSRASMLLKDLDIPSNLTIFNTGSKQVSDRYFLDSGDKIRCFFEEKACSDNKLLVAKDLAVNKIGHCLHELDPVFAAFSKQTSIKEMAKVLGFSNPLMIQSMLIFKQPRLGGPVDAHVDSSFLYTQPLSATGFWFALEDCTLQNGCLWFAPGSHKHFELPSRFVRNGDSSTKLISLNAAAPLDEQYVAVPVKAGSLVLIHGSVYHKSGPNLSEKSRWIYTFHLIEGDYEYPSDNWLQPTNEIPFTKLY
jgi:ectoine hydroxylase-related dioxygenase (phytanoyl-CoA dioxygenase family)